MLNYKQNLNKINDLLIKNSDMIYDMKFEITGIVKNALKLTGDDYKLASKIVTQKLEEKYGGAWVCIIGIKFVANIMHEPGHFLRASNQNRHFVIFKFKFDKESQRPKLKLKDRDRSNSQSKFNTPHLSSASKD